MESSGVRAHLRKPTASASGFLSCSMTPQCFCSVSFSRRLNVVSALKGHRVRVLDELQVQMYSTSARGAVRCAPIARVFIIKRQW